MSNRTRQAADRAASAIGELAALTATGQDDPQSPADVSEIIAGLQVMAGQLPQIVAHLASWLTAEARAGRIGYDGADPARQQIAYVNAYLSQALAGADQLAAALNEAHKAAARLTCQLTLRTDAQRLAIGGVCHRLCK
jgi:hypothetical protein